MVAEKTKYESVNACIKFKLPGDSDWTECPTSTVSSNGLFVETSRPLNVADLFMLQFKLQSRFRMISNVHFFVSAKVLSVEEKNGVYGTAVEFIINEDVRKEITKMVDMIKSQNMEIERPTNIEAVLKGKTG